MERFFKNVLKWSGMVAVVVITYGVLLRLANVQTPWLATLLGYLSIIILPAGIFMGMWQISKQQKLTILNGILTGLSIAFVSALMLILYRLIYDYFTDNIGNLDAIINYERAKMQQAGATEAKIAERVDDIRTNYPPYQSYFNTLKWYLLLGSGYTIISYLILMIKVKRNEKIKT